MGIIFRNGIPFGAAEDDVTTVYAYEDLFDLTDKKENHLYIVEETSIPYRYDIETEQFYPLGKDMVIPGQNNQVVVADGQDKAKANTGGFYAFGSDNISKMDFGYSELELKSLTEYAPDTYWGLNKNEAKIHLKGNPLLQMINQENGGPIISMLGRGIIDFKGDHNSFGDCTNYNQAQRKQSSQPTWMSENAYVVYRNSPSPFSDKSMSEDDTIYPLLSLKHCATIQATDTALAQFTGGSSLIVGGNADIVIRGADDMGKPSSRYGRTRVDIEPGSHFIMQMSNSQQYPTAPFFLMESYEGGGQILLSTSLKATTGRWTNFREGDEDFNGIKLFKGYSSPLAGFSSSNIFGNGGKIWFSLGEYGIRTTDFHSYMEDYKNTTCLLQGNTNLVIGDSGHIGMRIGPDSGGDILVDWTPDDNTMTYIKFGGATGSAQNYLIEPEANAVQSVKFDTHAGGATILNIVPHGSTSFQFSPENIFGMTVTPSSTNIMCQWKHLTGIFEGQDVFIQIEDNIHKEMLNNSIFIQKGYSNSSINMSDSTIDINKGRKVKLTNFYIPTSYTDFENYYSNDNNKTIFHSAIIHIDSLSESFIPDQYTNSYVKKTNSYKKNMYKTRLNYSSGTYVDMTISYASDTLYTKADNYNAPAYYGAFAATYEISSNVPSVRSSKLLGYYNGKYYYQAVLSVYIKSFFCYTFKQYNSGTKYSKLDSEDKYLITQQLHLKDGGLSDYMVVVQSESIQVANPEYEITTSVQHLGEDWSRPVQQGGENRSANGSIIQTYDASNFLMRSSLPNPSIYSGANITVANDYTGYTDKRELIMAFKNSADYDTFLNAISFPNEYELWDIQDITAQTSTNVIVLYTAKKVGWDAHLKSVADNPVLELTGQSELRLYDDIYIKGEVEYGTPVYTFGDSKHPENQVSFTLAELKALKVLLTQIPIQVVQSSSEATEPGIMYFVDGGGN